MKGYSHSLRAYGALHNVLLAFGCFVMVLLSGSPQARQAGSEWHSRQGDHRAGQIEALTKAAGPLASIDTGSSSDLSEEVVEVAESTDDDDTKHSFLPFDAVLRFEFAAFATQADLIESFAERAPTRFLLGAISSRGSPLA